MARNDIDFKEYSRLRDIAHKRVQRLEKAGFTPNIQLPTVKQVRASDNPYFFLAELRKFVNAPTTVKEVRLAGTVSLPASLKPVFPQVAEIAKETELQKKIRKREQARRTRVRRAIRESAPEGKTKQQLGYLKAAQTIAQQWMQLGKISGDVSYMEKAKWLLGMTPKQAKAFVAYTEYRFSQADFTNRYVINRFAEEFTDLLAQERNVYNIEKDFGNFLADQRELEARAKETNETGMPAGQLLQYFTKFVRG